MRRFHARRVRFAHLRNMKFDAGAVERPLARAKGLITDVMLEACHRSCYDDEMTKATATQRILKRSHASELAGTVGQTIAPETNAQDQCATVKCLITGLINLLQERLRLRQATSLVATMRRPNPLGRRKVAALQSELVEKSFGCDTVLAIRRQIFATAKADLEQGTSGCRRPSPRSKLLRSAVRPAAFSSRGPPEFKWRRNIHGRKPRSDPE